jgi:hypothetical protein
MKPSLIAIAVVLAAVSAPSVAQGGPAAAPNSCYIEVQKLMGAAPGGITDLRAAVAQLDTKLHDQVEEVNRLKRLSETLAQQQQQAMQAAGATAEDGAPAPESPDVARISQDLRRTNDELLVKQAQLQADYRTQMAALVGPVQQRVGQRALVFGSQRGCGSLKMARTPDLASLQSSGARDVTLDFVSWYGKS